MLGHSILTQFEQVIFEEITLPFVDSIQKAKQAVEEINHAGTLTGRPVIFSTLVDSEISSIVQSSNALYMDCFQVFIAPMESELGVKSNHSVGRSHSAINSNYLNRMDAVNFALASDDGQSTKELKPQTLFLSGSQDAERHPPVYIWGCNLALKRQIFL